MPSKSLSPLALIDAFGGAVEAAASGVATTVAHRGLTITRAPAVNTALPLTGDIYTRAGTYFDMASMGDGSTATADPCSCPLAFGLIGKVIEAFHMAPPVMQELNDLDEWENQAMPPTPTKRNADSGAWEFAEPPGVLDLLWCPNPDWTREDLEAALICDLYREGNAYLYIVDNGRALGKQPLELLWVPACECVPQRREGSTRLIDWYEWRVPGKVPIVMQVDDVIHFRAKHPHPLNDMLSASPLMLLGPHAALLEKNVAYGVHSADNMGRPSVVAVPDVEGPTTTTDEVAKAMRAEWTALTSKRKRGGLYILKDKWKLTTLDFPPEQVVSQILIDEASAAICLAMNIDPTIAPTVLGIREGNYAARQAAQKQFWQECMMPLGYRFYAALTKRLLARYEAPSRRRQLGANFKRVPALKEDFFKTHQAANDSYRWGVSTRGESRQMVGLSPKAFPKDDPDVRYTDSLGANMAPGGGKPMLPSGGGQSDKPANNAVDGQNPTSPGNAGTYGSKSEMAEEALPELRFPPLEGEVFIHPTEKDFEPVLNGASEVH